MECLVFYYVYQGAVTVAMHARLGVTKEQPCLIVDGIRVFLPSRNPLCCKLNKSTPSAPILPSMRSSDAVLSSDIDPPEVVLDLLTKPSVQSSPAFDHDGNVLVYIAGYIADKIVGKFAALDGPCKECTLHSTHVPTDGRYTFLKDKQYTDLALGDKPEVAQYFHWWS
ncbi:hypothetical protein QQF64_034310 [Cirrhinus molitorella]|uniref:Uncharacterized protein n=1 Tax=Cirrhinus molitorella TaxID=172907 RepID=A0ABR3L1F9_9TELE